MIGSIVVPEPGTLKAFGSCNNKNTNKKQENQREINESNNQNQFSQSGVYLRDDHCDWGSSGMNEFTQEFSEKK